MKKVIISISVFIISFTAFKLIISGSYSDKGATPLMNITISKLQIVTPSVWYATLNYNGKISLLKTTNSGNNWTLYIDLLNGYAGISAFQDFHFPDINTGYACGGNSNFSYVAKTTDGGITWDTVSSANPNMKTAIHFSTPNIGYLAGAQNTNSSLNKTFATTNGGLNWVSTMEGTGGWERGITLITNSDSTHFFTNLQSYPFIFKNTLGTPGWTQVVSLPGYSEYITDIEFKDANTGIFLFPDVINTYLGVTFNGFSSYTTKFIYPKLNKASLTGNTIYCFKYSPGAHQFMKSTDFGDNWTYYDYDVQFLNNGYPDKMDALNNLIFASLSFGNDTNAMMRSTNGGVNWSYMSIPPPTSVITGTVRYSDNNQIITSGTVKAIKLDAVSGGLNFVDSAQIDANGKYTLKNLTSDSVYIGVYPNTSPIKDWVVSYYSETCDWRNAVLLRPSGRMRDVDIKVQRMQNNTASNSINGKILKLNKSAGNLKDAVIYARNGNTYVGCAVSDANGVYRIQSLPAGNLKVIATRIGYLPDSASVNITPTSNIDSVNFILSRILIGIRTIEGETPSGYSLRQNYPNPFNPSTIIEFSIPKSGNVCITLYDITGKEIRTLFKGFKQSGNYALDFKADELAAGVYFYRMTSNEFTDTKKMLIIK